MVLEEPSSSKKVLLIYKSHGSRYLDYLYQWVSTLALHEDHWGKFSNSRIYDSLNLLNQNSRGCHPGVCIVVVSKFSMSNCDV